MSGELEERVTALEKELFNLKKKLEANNPERPWWEVISGSFAGDASYQEAMKLGAEYRRGQGSIPNQPE